MEEVMIFINSWIDDNLNKLYYLNNERHYLRAVEIRGDRYRLKLRAKKYLLDKAQELLLNKMRRRRLK